MAKNKLKRFSENKTFENVVQPTREEMINNFPLKGKWNKEFFKNDNPIVLELGCGKGEYTIALAEKFPEKNFIGIDIKGARFWRGAKTALENEKTNAGFLRTQIELVDHAFAENEVSEIWITFPDPQIKLKRTKHRLTHPDFLRRYHKILNENGIVHLKTDSEFLHGYTHGIIQSEGHKVLFSNHNIYHPDNHEIPTEVVSTQTYYEQKFLDERKNITYIRFTLKY
ncbi:tRNA (guanosine(46)-N7)-methyltransferase TrmB [Moheibacter sediminis]|uniref:tRNA (guanine-N(7)-)-methyltransferase n=1 Tax=Moheibacter sediminis TaxID=1434700 RepID=A0A1W1YAA9_9FLAO|nr:tRNA (guanosine(46)-N7)-methyltransferase TrmB [Moheibacter sediminis]SMC32761.1 tRNA (guanine-N(7)-)-methyltransferase [Moheibacter sediminis]